MRVIFFGTSAFAVPSVERLVREGHTILCCVTQPDRPQGRGRVLAPSPVKQAAARLKLPLSQPLRPLAEPLALLQPEVGVVAAYGQLIRRELLALPRHGMLGVHPSLLPAYRGAAPVAWALLNGETTTGVTIFRLNEALDAGKILSQRAVAIDPQENAETLTERLARLGAEELSRTLQALAAGNVRGQPQDPSRASEAPKLTKAQGRIDWQAPAETIVRLVRATVPWPGATTQWRGMSLKILSASSHEPLGPLPSAGRVLQAAPEGIIVAAGQGAVVLREVQPAGRRRMSAGEFLAGHPIRIGEQLGSGMLSV